jgi:NADH-quinone oxidoreductase subunit E
MGADEVKFSQELTAFIEEWKNKPGSLIMMLHRIQEELSYIPLEAAEKLSEMINMPLTKIYGVMTFYHFFKTTKPGKHLISVCLGTACYLKGSQALLDEAQNLLGIKEGQVSKDGLFSVEAVRCVGCCGLSPVLTVGKDVYGKVTKSQIPEIISKYQAK